MNGVVRCVDVRADIPELALGVLGAAARQPVLEHVAGCVECRAFLDEITEVADSLLLVAPEIQPPRGLDERVLARIDSITPSPAVLPGPPPRPRQARVLRLAAAAAVLVALVVGGVSIAGRSRDGTTHVALVSTSSHATIGEVYVHGGQQPWLFVTYDNPRFRRPTSTYLCRLVLDDGRVVDVGRFDAHDGVGEWGAGIDVDPAAVDRMEMTTDEGRLVATAELG